MKTKVIVIGLDGLEPAIVDSLLQRGELPNLCRIRQHGHYGRIKTTYPAQTPVAWSSFATGTNPGGPGIFDFIRRDPETYLPDLALSQFQPPRNAFSPPRVVSRRKGIPLWKLLAQAGVPSTVLRFPCAFPPDVECGRILGGVGVPDLRGGQGTGTFYTQDTTATAKEHEQLIHLGKDDDIKTYVIGPRNTRVKPFTDVTAGIRVRVDRAASKLIIETGGTPAKIEVAEKTWGPWVRLKFKLSMLQSITGTVRFYVCQLAPQVQFYVSPVNFDPASPLYPISAPTEYAGELADKVGLFSTLGMAEDHNAYNNGRFDEQAYQAQCDSIFEEREKMMLFELDRFDEGFFFVLFDTPDRIQHMFWRFRDREHPGYNPELAKRFEEPIEEMYRRCDKMMGRVADRVDENTLLMVMSDHGFNSFRRSFDTNTWLWQQGLLALKSNKRPEQDLTSPAENIDWSKTYAYAVGLGGIYLNLRDRERAGIVGEGTEADRVRRAIEKGLTEIVDSERQRPAIRSVSRRESIYSGPFVGESPDLLVNFYGGYRVSWQSALGGFSDTLLGDNTRFWSGDHIIDPEAVPGVLFTNHPVLKENAALTDMAPTILHFLGVPAHPAMEGESLI
jgi:predicted AlkP superfamily phosphohydrolase/phosphomutase